MEDKLGIFALVQIQQYFKHVFPSRRDGLLTLNSLKNPTALTVQELTRTPCEQQGSAASSQEPNQHNPRGSSKTQCRREPRLLHGWVQLHWRCGWHGHPQGARPAPPSPVPQLGTIQSRCHFLTIARLRLISFFFLGGGEGFNPNSSAENEVTEKICYFNAENILTTVLLQNPPTSAPRERSPSPKSALWGCCEDLPVFCCRQGDCSCIEVLLWVIALAAA